jgi:DNA-binding NtrC family response regulator
MAGLLLRQGRDPIHLLGEAGTGKSLVADVVHDLAASALGRSDARVDLDCSAVSASSFAKSLREAAAASDGGTLVLDRMEALNSDGLARVERLQRGEKDILLVGLAQEATGATGARIKLKPLHEREDDVWALTDHYFGRVYAELPDHGCLGFSRQAKADIAARVQETGVKSLCVLRDIVRDAVYEAVAAGPLPDKLTSDWVRPILEARYGQSPANRLARDTALLESAFEALGNPSMVARLSEIHGVPESVLENQAEVMRAAIDTLDGLPRSYRNIMDRADDILRASLWLVSGAETQAEFRRFFGDERFMRPTKSVAWAFFNRVFKRDMG